MWNNVRYLLPILLLHVNLSAQNQGTLKGFYGTVNTGPGIVNGNIKNAEIQTTPQFAMHFCVGYFVNKTLQLGLTGNGWLFQPYRSTRTEEKGESLSNSMIHVQFYPTTRYRLFIKGGFGISKYKNNRPLEDNGKGHAFMTALGYEKQAGKKELLLGGQLSYSNGRLRYGDLYTAADQLQRKFQVFDFTFFIGLD